MIVKEIFYSLQGEGRFTGTPAVFIRLSGCNLRCPFCDTDHLGGTELTHEEIFSELGKYSARHVVVTGGEPSLQLDGNFVDMLHDAGYFVQVETNGTHMLPANVDWITCSPKDAPIVYSKVDELKVVFLGDSDDDVRISSLDSVYARERYLQPCDVGDEDANRRIISGCVDYIKAHPEWKLSLQTHKLIDIP
ncbi:7-carboxy-7-deazaguanine synthase QueE [uncultured Muribaculum sp.]|uniref:7-carboxy-7-deazaguanine synthase QueE n=1 Tax=uncultured Muribaculum sp. TaxID=1918613 RepID=UPI0025F3B1A2|nr:7-carboxy-7-deazaguanine synthase QueE [uncultured Muribaculum sp.]